jgi:hypothetical protein
MDNLWPENISEADYLTPLTILQEQAALLGTRTRNIVTADVETVIDDDNKKPFTHVFYIVAPMLQNYRYRLLLIVHDIELYPIDIYTDEEIFDDNVPFFKIEEDYQRGRHFFKANTELEFIEALKVIFSSRKAQRIIKNLMNQSKQLGGYTSEGTAESIPF